MTENTNQPKEYDVVLGGGATAPADGVVLGGLERVKQALVTGAVEQRIDALLDAFQYGQLGLDLVIQALEDKSEKVQEAAYWLLQDITEPRSKVALQAYNPYLFFEYLRTTIDNYTEEVCQIIHTFQQGETNRSNYVVVTPDNQILGLWSCNDYAEVWNVKTGLKIFITPRSSDMFWSVVISPDGHTLASTGDANVFNLWDIRTGGGFYIEIPEGLPRRYLIYSDSQILVTEHGDKDYNRILE